MFIDNLAITIKTVCLFCILLLPNHDMLRLMVNRKILYMMPYSMMVYFHILFFMKYQNIQYEIRNFFLFHQVYYQLLDRFLHTENNNFMILSNFLKYKLRA